MSIELKEYQGNEPKILNNKVSKKETKKIKEKDIKEKKEEHNKKGEK